MPQFYDYKNDPESIRKRKRAQMKRRRRLIQIAALFTVVLALVVFGVTSLLNMGKSSPKATPVPSQSQAPTITPQQFQISETPTPSVTVPPPTATPVPTPAPTVSTVKASGAYKIKVSTAKQTVTVLDANNQVVKSFVCSTGLDGADTETPLGTYTIAERGESFFSQTYQQGAYYWTQFYGDYLFHSVPFDKNRQFETAEAAKLGTKASHGCVRLALENAKWIYDNIPRGTTVVIE